MKKITKEGKRKRVQTINTEKTRTQQQFGPQCNINNIMDKYKKTGTITHIRNNLNGVYADLTQIPDYADALQSVINAQQAFGSMPAYLRHRFNNDPASLIRFLADPANDREAVQLGLKIATKAPPSSSTPTPPTQPPLDPKLAQQKPTEGISHS